MNGFPESMNCLIGSTSDRSRRAHMEGSLAPWPGENDSVSRLDGLRVTCDNGVCPKAFEGFLYAAKVACLVVDDGDGWTDHIGASIVAYSENTECSGHSSVVRRGSLRR